MSLAKLHVGETAEIWKQVQPGIERAATLHQALQSLTDTLRDDYTDSIALARVFVTIPFADLPDDGQQFALNLIQDAGVAEPVTENTPVLSLLATSGQEPEWNRLDNSERHRCIPLVSDRFVAEIPMVSRLLTDLGVAADLGVDPGATYRDDPTSTVHTFYVHDALTEVDPQGRKVIANQQFAEQYGIRTVFGGGAPYTGLPQYVLALILFTKEHVSHDIACAFEPFIATVQTATTKFLENGKVF